MGDLLAQIFGGGKQTAPTLQGYTLGQATGDFNSQDFAGAGRRAQDLSASTSAGWLDTFLAGLNKVSPNAVSGNAEVGRVGEGLLKGTLPDWASSFLNKIETRGAERALASGAGATSERGRNIAGAYAGDNVLELLGVGSQMVNQSAGTAAGWVDANSYRADPMNFLYSPEQAAKIGMYNTDIANQNEVNRITAQNWNENNSPLGNAIRWGTDTVIGLVSSYLGGSGEGLGQNVGSKKGAFE